MGDARKWQGPQVRKNPGRAPTAKRRPLVYGVAFLILALAGALTALVFFMQRPPQPLLVVVRIDQYRDALLPVSPWGDQDRAALHGLGMHEQGAFTSQERQLLLQEFNSLGRDLPAGQPLVVYLCAYATATKDGVAILPADARLDEPDSWLPFKDVLDAIKGSPAKHKLLLLDLTLPCATPRGGLLANDAADRLDPILQAAVQSDATLQILTATSPGQVSLASEEMGQTVFAFYVVQALRGDADGCLSAHAPNQRVSVQELQTYVKTQVDRWAWHNRKTHQTPIFHGSADDYELRGTGTPATVTPAPLTREYPAFLQRAWKERDKWWNDRGSRTPAGLYRQFDGDALRAEERWRGGEDPAKVQAYLDPRLNRLVSRRRDEKIGGEAGEPQSLAQAIAAGQKPPTEGLTEAVRDLKALAQLYVLAHLPKPNQQDTDRLTKDTEAFRKKFEGRPFELAWTVYAVATAVEEPPQDYLRCWYGLLQPEESQPPPVYREALLLKQLAKWRLDKPADWPAAAVPAVLQLMGEAETVKAGNPQLQPWLQKDYADAMQKRRTAEKLFFDPDAAKRAAAAPAVAAALEKYQALAATLRILNNALRQRDEALAFLPAYPAYMEYADSNEKVWSDAVDAVRKLDGLLAKPTAEALPEVDERARTLSDSLRKLRQPLETAGVQKPIDASRPVSAADAMEMSALLRLPGPSEVGRLALWNNYRSVAGRLHAEAVAREQSSDGLPSPDEGVVLVRQERQRALMRARASLTLLQLSGAQDAEQVERELQKVTRTPTDEAAWWSLGRALSRAWKQYDADRARSDKN